MTEQIIPERFGPIRRWFYTMWPLNPRNVCPLTNWKHQWVIDPQRAHLGDYVICNCGARGLMDYDR